LAKAVTVSSISATGDCGPCAAAIKATFEERPREIFSVEGHAGATVLFERRILDHCAPK